MNKTTFRINVERGYDPYNSVDNALYAIYPNRLLKFSTDCELLRAQAGATAEDRARTVSITNPEYLSYAYRTFISDAERVVFERLRFDGTAEERAARTTDPDLYMSSHAY